MEEVKIDVQEGRRGGYLGLPIRTILATFDLQITLILPTKFRVSWALCSKEEVQNRFS